MARAKTFAVFQISQNRRQTVLIKAEGPHYRPGAQLGDEVRSFVAVQLY